MICTIPATVLSCEKFDSSDLYKTMITQENKYALTTFTRDKFYKGDVINLQCSVQLKKGEKSTYLRIVQIK
jgi:hypothetical protein